MAQKPQPDPASAPTPKVRSCGTMPVHQRLLRTSPAYVRARIASENFAHAVKNRMVAARTGVTTIPVVVHVVHNTDEQNLSESQIKSQIDVLNRDYRLKNPDIASIPAPFKTIAADARVEFRLATEDPDGNPTTGITRTQTNKASFTDDDGIKAASTGGHDPWPADKYLNIWTAPRLTSPQGDLLGYAQFPGGPPETDGVVILHSAFGTTGTAAAPFNLGRTATHEVGHWLNLRHIWGDDGNGCNGSDFVNDTPNQAGPNFGAPAFPHVTCTNGPSGDMFMDYMDYVDDAAMFMFTAGQVDRMQACLDGDRSSIGTTAAAPTLKFGDDQPPPTTKFTDDQPPPTTKFTDDQPPPTTKFTDDQPPPTSKFSDDQPPPTTKFTDDHPPTLKFADDPGGPTLKFADDVQTFKFIDDHHTLKFIDDPGGPTLKFIDEGGSLKFMDDVKLPTLDKSPVTDQPKSPFSDNPGFPGGIFEDPFFGGERAAPFVLSTPHHSMAWTRTFPGAAQSALAAYAAQIQQCEHALNAFAQSHAAGRMRPEDMARAHALHREYQALMQEYRHLSGG